ncbi:MAG: FecR domain-containing protein [Porticoccaceae bacterium]
MTKIYEFSSQDKISDEASLWLSRLDRGLSEDEKRILQQWMAIDIRHRQTLFAMAAVWDKMDSLSRLSDLFPTAGTRKIIPADYRRVAGIAIVFLGVAVSGLFLFLKESKDVLAALQGNTVVYETSVGGHSLVNLPDNSKVLLNTDSQIQVRYSDRQRDVILVRGEAHFTVAKDNERAFVVEAGGREIKAVGTAFNVKMNEENLIALIVTEGKVTVGDKKAASVGKLMTPFNLSEKTPMVSEGEAAILTDDGAKIIKIEPEKVAASLSWQQGNLVFQGETLEEAIKEISRYTTIDFEIADENLKNVRVAGLFRSDDINGLLVTLHENFNISSEKVEDKRILLKMQNTKN